MTIEGTAFSNFWYQISIPCNTLLTKYNGLYSLSKFYTNVELIACSVSVMYSYKGTLSWFAKDRKVEQVFLQLWKSFLTFRSQREVFVIPEALKVWKTLVASFSKRNEIRQPFVWLIVRILCISWVSHVYSARTLLWIRLNSLLNKNETH